VPLDAWVVAISLFMTTGQVAMTSRVIRPVIIVKPASVGKIAGERSDNQYWRIKSPLAVRACYGVRRTPHGNNGPTA